MEPLGPRRLSAIPDEDIKKTVAEDVVIHCDDETYDIVIATPVGYDYRVTCPDFKTISKDRDYVIRCLIQADNELRHGSNHWFPDPQPFQITRQTQT